MLTFKAAVLAAEKAFHERRLAAQNGYTVSCLYEYPDGSVCAIGAAYVPEDPCLNDQDVIALAEVAEIPEEDLPLLQYLQHLHDAWVPGKYPVPSGCELRHLPQWLLDWIQEHRAEVVGPDTFMSFIQTAKEHI